MASIRTLGALALLGLLAIGRGPVWAETVPGAAGEAAAETGDVHVMRRLPFNIPAQPLAHALDAYFSVTGRAVMVDSRLARRTIRAVQGEYTPTQALSIMLEGSGLAWRSSGRGAYTIVDEPAAPAAPPARDLSLRDIPGADSSAQLSRYLGRVQQGLTRALCRQPLTAPGGWRLALQIRIDAAGRMTPPHLLGSTGDVARDQAISAALTQESFGLPPAGLPQPITLLLEADRSRSQTECQRLLATER